LAARIVRLADVFDALQNERPYKEAWTLARSLEEIERGAGTLFDPDLAQELIALLQSGSGLSVPVAGRGSARRKSVAPSLA
jgi:HD-GYP domain-containing protein (c-di-GMP phosphodiesterase class II)